MEYDCCPFCKKQAFGYRKTVKYGNKTLNYFMCTDCVRILLDVAKNVMGEECVKTEEEKLT